MKYVIPSGRVGAPESVGAKFHRQDVLRQAGLPVPDFFCIGRAAWEAWILPRRAEIERRLATIDTRSASAADAGSREAIAIARTLPVPSAVAEEISRTPLPGLRLAVRGCFVEFEDSPDDPFAGMSQSFLDVAPRDLAARLIDCWCSSLSPRALLYAQGRLLSVAVGVQAFVPADTSFVIFTHDPLTAERRTIVAAAAGRGEALVEGRTDAEHYVAGEAPRGKLLSKPGLDELDRLARRVEAVLGGAQDIEGCITEGRPWIVQARPVRFDGVVWDNSNVTESFPDIALPLTYSFARAFYGEIFRDCFRLLGIDRPDLEQEFDRMIGYLDGRIYYRLTTFYRLFGAHPLFPMYRPHWERSISLNGSYDPRPPAPAGLLSRARGWLNLAWNAFRVGGRMRRLMRDFEREAAAIERLDLRRLSASELATGVRTFGSRFFRRWGPTLVNDIVLILGYGALLRKGLSPAVIHDHLAGDEELLSARIVESVVAIGERLQAGEDVSEAVREHLARFGYRGIGDLHLDRPPPDEREILTMARRYAAEGVRVANLRERARGIRKSAEEALPRGAVLRALLTVVRRAVRRREESRYARSRFFGICRRLFNEAGARLAQAGILASGSDVHYLTGDELFGLIDGTSVLGDARQVVEQRRRDIEACRSKTALPHFTTQGPVSARLWARKSVETGTELKGLGASAGTAHGRAQVVLHPDPAAVPAGDFILVARETDPGWLFLMLTSKGIVVERGSPLSHTAITARRFGIPAVVGVRDATARIRDGDLVEIDGAQGAIRVLERSSP